jgi:16S rRNA (adenine1518-N6/adenine1519-N6)-dimethyltransferase
LLPARSRRPTSGKRRALGQHFLRDDDVARRIVDLVSPTGPDLVVEIGPGQGALTGRLAGAAGRVLAIEVDPSLAAALAARFAATPTVEVQLADALRFDYRGLAARRPSPDGRVLVVGNLPYSVGTAILLALIEAAPAIVSAAPMEMALMLQREVAERVAAAPGSRDYGSLSVLAQMACEVRLAMLVPPGAFRPPPKVESAVIHLRARPHPAEAVADRRRFEEVVRAAFSQRRKTLANALSAGLRLSGDTVRHALAAAGIDPARRAETLSLAEFARLAAAFPG